MGALGHSRGQRVQRSDFSPATSSDDLRKYVLPEVERRGEAGKWVVSVMDCMDATMIEAMHRQFGGRLVGAVEEFYAVSLYMHFLPPAVLAAAALKVLGGGE